ncbi:DUF3782 domain-containing protein [Sulfuricystis multivorans]|uniref:DUF3782 domain-containing protein n=1 Tax=Sulfuricystis multivorans TaxID=2211108 RepID=UPI000F818380|nr:DUF3782 domain-containing protein [Sulfuricystis multivorans]
MSTATDLSWDDIKQMIAQLAEQSKETDQLIRELRESNKETDRQIRELKRQLGHLGNRLGEFVQDMVQPAVVGLFQAQGIPVHQVLPNVRAYDDARRCILEVDLLVINGEHAIAVECKSRLSTDDVDEHLARLAILKSAMPQYADKILHGAVAAMSCSESVARYAEAQGLYVLVQADDDVVLQNAPGFMPRAW